MAAQEVPAARSVPAWLLAAVMTLVVLAGCTVFAAQPADDPNAGGGRVGSGAEPAGQPAGGGAAPNPDVGGGKADPSTFAEAQNPADLPGFAVVTLDALKAGQSLTRGQATFTLESVSAGPGETTVAWQVSGLPGGYAPSGQESVTAIQTQDGSLLPALGAQGSVSGVEGGSAVETARMTFSALPAGARAFTLLLPNTWNGATETWVIPVVIE